VHRDVKPSNLIVDANGHLKLVDFGIARITDGAAQLTNAAALMGTPSYMAPEQAAGKKVDGRADVYALGMTLFELLAGGPAFVADDPIALVVMNMQDPLPDLRPRAPDAPEELVQLIEQMTTKDPAERLQSCDAVMAALEDLEARLRTGTGAHERRTDQASAAIPPTNVHGARPLPAATPAPGAARRRTPLLVGLGTAALVLLAGTALVLKGRTSAAPPPPIPVSDPPPPKPVIQVAAPHTVEEHAQLVRPRSDGPLRVAVLKFKNVGAEPSLAVLELGIGETAVNAMAQAGGGVTLVERGDIESDIGEIDRALDEHFDKATMAQKGKLAGVQMAVQGGFQRAGRKVRITARFVRVENGEIVDTLTVTRPAKDLFGAQDEVAKGLTQKLLALAALEKVK
jgi:TolB-like protein